MAEGVNPDAGDQVINPDEGAELQENQAEAKPNLSPKAPPKVSSLGNQRVDETRESVGNVLGEELEVGPRKTEADINPAKEILKQGMGQHIVDVQMSRNQGTASMMEIISRRIETLDERQSAAFLSTVKGAMLDGLNDTALNKADSAKIKSLKESVKAGASIDSMLSMVESFDGSKEATNRVKKTFYAAIRRAYTPYGFLNHDEITGAIAETTLKNKDGEEVKMQQVLDTLLGKGKGLLPDTDDGHTLILGTVIREMIAEANVQADDGRDAEGKKAKNVADILQGLVGKMSAAENASDIIAKEAQKVTSEFIPKADEALRAYVDASIEEGGFKPRIDRAQEDVASIQLRIDNAESRRKKRAEDLNGTSGGSQSLIEGDLRKIDAEINALEDKKRKAEEAKRAIEDKQQESTNKLTQASNNLIQLASNLAAYINKRLEKEEVKSMVKIADGSVVQSLLALSSDSSESILDKAKKVYELLNQQNLINLKQELSDLAPQLAEKRPFTPTELLTHILIEKNMRESGCNAHQAKMKAIVEIESREMERHLAEFYQDAQEARFSSPGRIKAMKERLSGKVERLSSKEAIKRMSNASEFELTGNQSKFLQELSPNMTYEQVHKHLLRGVVDQERLTSFMFGLMSLVGARKTQAGTYLTLKKKEIPAIENLVTNISEHIAVLNAVEINKRYRAEGSNGIENLSSIIAAYNVEFEDTLSGIAARSMGQPTEALTRLQLKVARDRILKEAIEKKWSRAQYVEALKKEDLYTRLVALNLLGSRKMLASLGSGVKAARNKMADAYQNAGGFRGVAEGTIKAPFRLVGAVAKAPFNAIGAASHSLSFGVAKTTAAVTGAATTLALAPIGIAGAAYKGVKSSARGALAKSEAAGKEIEGLLEKSTIGANAKRAEIRAEKEAAKEARRARARGRRGGRDRHSNRG